MPVPLNQAQVEQVKNIGNAVRGQYPRAFSNCHVEGNPENMDFIILFARAAYNDALLNSSHKAGMNGKRGNPSDPSLDVLCFRANSTTNDRDVTVADVVAGAGSSTASIYYNDITDPSGAGAIWLNPFDWNTYYDYGVDPDAPEPEPTPEPPPSPMIPYDEAKSIEFGHGCNGVYAESGAAMDAGMISVHSSRAAWDYYVGGLTWPDSYKKHINEFRAVYGLPPV